MAVISQFTLVFFFIISMVRKTIFKSLPLFVISGTFIAQIQILHSGKTYFMS